MLLLHITVADSLSVLCIAFFPRFTSLFNELHLNGSLFKKLNKKSQTYKLNNKNCVYLQQIITCIFGFVINNGSVKILIKLNTENRAKKVPKLKLIEKCTCEKVIKKEREEI